MKYDIKELNVADIELDVSNPRIASQLEMYGDNITAESIALALTDPSESDAGTTFISLRESIKANGGIIHPIVVNKHDGKYTVIEGNTRVQIYKDFIKNGTKGRWDTIIALVYTDMDEYTIHSIRLQSHLVGPRAWNPYSKAKYLKKLSDEDCLSINQIIDLCGGKKSEIISLIQAYNDMEQYYHSKLDNDQEFDPMQFSAFRELNQSKKRTDALVNNGYTKADFGQWVINGLIDNAQDVRKFPEILNNPESKKIFFESGLKKAAESIHIPSPSELNIPLEELAEIMSRKVINLTWIEMKKMMAGEDERKLNSLIDLKESLDEILKRLTSEIND